jgi:hypothetical protein
MLKLDPLLHLSCGEHDFDLEDLLGFMADPNFGDPDLVGDRDFELVGIYVSALSF